MSTLHRLKAYFGMVPAEEMDYYDGHGSLYDRADDVAPPATTPPTRAARPAPSPPGPSSAHPGSTFHAGRRVRPVDYDDLELDGVSDYAPPRQRTVRRGGWSAEEPPPLRGSLALDHSRDRDVAPDRASNLREALREPVTAQRPPFEEASPAEPPADPAETHAFARIVTLHPRNYNEARPIGERYREGTPVIMNLTEMDDADAKRLVDFAVGLAFALRGSIDKVTKKVFLLSPPNVEVTAEDKRRLMEDGFFNQS